MWLYCPNCKHQTNAEGYSLYSVFRCSACNRRFRGIHAKINQGYHSLVRLFSVQWSRVDVTTCPFCQSNVWGTDNGGGNVTWPTVCSECGRDLPTGPAENPAPVVSQQSSATKSVQITPSQAKPSSPPHKQADDFDGCGPCTSCGFIFQMMFNNAVCPKCGKKMSREDAFFSCGSYPHSTPPENQ